MSEDLTGRMLGHYRIDSVLGRGGMSVLYRATDVRLDRQVALKVISPALSDDAEFRERFVDEARNTSAVDHANVVPLYDFGDVDGLLFIAMRLVEGTDLAGLLQNGPLTPERTLLLLGQAAEALDTVHGKGLVHLDVKPANILVTTRDALREHVYLADFGLTRRGATGHRTRAGDFLGSPTYAAPEHLRGEPVDGRTDEYALACVLFACLAGKPPFAGGVPDVISGHLNTPTPTLTSVTSLPPAIDSVIDRGMAKNPEDRFGNCRALIAAARTALYPAIHPGSTPVRPTNHGRARPGRGRSAYPRTPAPPAAEPVRLRPPVAPTRSTAFTENPGRVPRWVAPLAVLLVLAAVVAVILLLVPR